MLLQNLSTILVEQRAVASLHLNRYVIADVYLPKNISDPSELSLLIINDGQDLEDMPFAPTLDGLLSSGQIAPLLCVGLHCNKYRRDEYGTANVLDYAGRGKRSKAYQQFIVDELIPFLHKEYRVDAFQEKAIAGFSLGGLSALDTAWNHPGLFSTVGVFSGSFWWRSKDVGEGYDDNQHRIMHQQIRNGEHQPNLRFYFMTGSQDETADRNNNGIIDSIDDTLDLIKELERLGYKQEQDIRYVNYENGRHDVQSWGKAMPAFLLWAWSGKNNGTDEQRTLNVEVTNDIAQ
ncbi:alpha/beta hydrolase [Flavisolibacter ginsenosidimutans]|uniref:Esterase family protein n=1 Tax=Flavisolibacter ginsenosidimutans TaxID=661481 RepID=A0A5B8UGW6_9BACT|nr:alpha/beta hydrolase-fold protein [Flavisolibacter ginsenosidimutans]QEC55566.1 esterase family protein [Flavisolibacter ginsenosidimutans]